jgi:hypothetical protein
VQRGASQPRPADHGIYLAHDGWPEEGAADATRIDLKLLFDDPDLADAEPVAVYPRKFAEAASSDGVSASGTPPKELPLANGRAYRGPMGMVFATGIGPQTPMGELPGQRTDAGEGPIFHGPPAGAVDRLRIYAARRDRFDDPIRPRIRGEWELLLEVPVAQGAAATWVPTDTPTVLVGLDPTGRVARWTTAARDKQGRQATFNAYAGDHYSLAQPRGRHFCVGCHPGHSGLSADHHHHAERLD